MNTISLTERAKKIQITTNFEFKDQLSTLNLKKNNDYFIPNSSIKYFLYISERKSCANRLITCNDINDLLNTYSNIESIFGKDVLLKKLKNSSSETIISMISTEYYDPDANEFIYEFDFEKVKKIAKRRIILGSFGNFNSNDIIRIDSYNKDSFKESEYYRHIYNILLKFGFDQTYKYGFLSIGSNIKISTYKFIQHYSQKLREEKKAYADKEKKRTIDKKKNDDSNYSSFYDTLNKSYPGEDSKKKRLDWKREAMKRGITVYL